MTILFDLDPEGEAGAKEALFTLGQLCPVRLGWSRSSGDGEFVDRQPESLSDAEWLQVARRLTTGA